MYSAPPAPHVRILMGTFQGAGYLSGQLSSFLAQDHDNWSLVVSDDGSTDATPDVVREFARAHPNRDIRLVQGPGQGASANYLSLLAQDALWRDLPDDGCIAFSDQDDVWMAERLARAIEALGQGADIYASRTLLTDADLIPRGASRQHPYPPAFGNALVQNVLAGNTLVLGPVAGALLRRTAARALNAGVPHHDWWVYLLGTGAGLHIVNDSRPGLYYRQHGGNLLGANRGLGKAWSRFAMIWEGHFGDWIAHNLSALQAVDEELTPENRACLSAFQAWLEGERRGLLGGGLDRTGAWRQSKAGQIMLRAAASAGRL
ncbi:glycosyltransferase [Pseudooceanicola atlanticus]|uniref:Glycosyltransferase 2-like domain-containing protein n=1 Tax=Pseudooceanicola atlanticus TaxID=1461694 RepID=A0A0A0EC04_9RHOB|nr:glycosyltransferase [Pseudooceanicola atlanticus]KGM46757.1 hypothetical protein ATO9_22080 [Pseudooceanicola atlanticus]